MHIDHIAIWTSQLETQKAFYETYFAVRGGQKYANPNTGFESYFLTFPGGARLELMQRPDVTAARSATTQIGYAHIAIAVGSRESVDALTERIRLDGYRVIGQPRLTGDGYYESVVLDPDGNSIEITV